MRSHSSERDSRDDGRWDQSSLQEAMQAWRHVTWMGTAVVLTQSPNSTDLKLWAETETPGCAEGYMRPQAGLAYRDQPGPALSILYALGNY